jgi:putative oxidoreductase
LFSILLEVYMAVPAPSLSRTGNDRFATSLALFVLRLILGWVFIYAGAGKLFGAFGGIGIDTWKSVMGMDAMKMPLLPPAAWAYISACSEFLCGILVLVGLLTRLAALPLIVTMCVAIGKAVGQNGFGGIPHPDGSVDPGYAYNLTLIAVSFALLLTGPGLVSIDALLFRRGLWSRGPQPLSSPEARP